MSKPLPPAARAECAKGAMYDVNANRHHDDVVREMAQDQMSVDMTELHKADIGYNSKISGRAD